MKMSRAFVWEICYFPPSIQDGGGVNNNPYRASNRKVAALIKKERIQINVINIVFTFMFIVEHYAFDITDFFVVNENGMNLVLYTYIYT